MNPEEIREARIALGFDRDQAGFGKIMGGYTARSISRLEQGKKQPVEVFCRLLRAYVDGYRPDDWPV